MLKLLVHLYFDSNLPDSNLQYLQSLHKLTKNRKFGGP